MLGELADDLSDETSDGYHEAAAPFAGINVGELVASRTSSCSPLTVMQRR